MGKLSDKVKDSALWRVARNVGFNARVEPFWYSFDRLKQRMGFFERWREKRKLSKLVGTMLKAEVDAAWLDRPGTCVCNLRVAKVGLLSEFQGFLRESAPSESSKWTHLFAQRDRDSWMVPADFQEPFAAAPFPGSITSSKRIAEELAEVNRVLKIDETFALAKAKKVDYLDATERDISIYESRFGTIEGFWGKFTYVLLKKLADTSVQHQFPAIFA